MGKIKVSQHPRPNLITYSRYSKHRILNLYAKAQVNHRMRTVRLAFYCHFRHLIISSSYLLCFQISNIHHHPTTTRIFTLGMISTVLTSQSINQTHVVIINSLKSMFSPEVWDVEVVLSAQWKYVWKYFFFSLPVPPFLPCQGGEWVCLPRTVHPLYKFQWGESKTSETAFAGTKVCIDTTHRSIGDTFFWSIIQTHLKCG